MRSLLAALTVALAGGVMPAAGAPFRLPPGAQVEESADGKGWQANGTLPMSFQAAQKRLAAAASASGWEHVHTISLGPDRILDAWSRGGNELTVMVWRMAPGKSGFSYGITEKSGMARGKTSAGKTRRRR